MATVSVSIARAAVVAREPAGGISRIGEEHRRVTHDVQEVVALADRVILIEHGRIELDQAVVLGRPRERWPAAAELLLQERA